MFKKIILTQDMKKDMILHSIAKRLVRNGRTSVRQGAHCSSLTGVLWLFVLLFLQMMGNIKSTSARRENDSQRGNKVFPAWETNVPSVGITFSPKAHFLRGLMLLLLIMTVGVNVAWAVDPPFTVTRDADGDGTIAETEKHLYLIRSFEWQSFYVVPRSTVNTNEAVQVSTSNVPNQDMLWYMMESDKEGYYFFVNNSTGRYLYVYSTDQNNTNGIRIKNKFVDSAQETEKDKYKFSISFNSTNNSYYIQPKSSSENYVNKKSGSSGYTNGLKVSSWDDGNSQWIFVEFTSEGLSWTAPCTLSTAESKTYYKIKNGKNTSFYISKNADGRITTSSDVSNESDDMVWYFVEVPKSSDSFNGSDNYITYYYIVNAETGKYMCFDKTATEDSQDDVAALQNKTEENEQNCQFVIVQSARDNNNKDKYKSIIPKLLKSYIWGSNSIALKDNSATTPVCTTSDRHNTSTNPTAHWVIEPATGYPAPCDDPVISCDADGVVSMTCTEDGAAIHYTIADGLRAPDDPTEADALSTTFSNPITSTKTIKAIAIKGPHVSSVVTQTIVYVPNQTFVSSTYDGTDKTPVVKVGETTISPDEYTVTYEKSGVAVTDHKDAGTYTVTITDKTDGDYIVYGSGSFTINKKALTITAKSKTIIYGDEPANDGVEYDGFADTENELVLGGTLAYAYNYSQYGDAGNYTITPSGLTSDNYAITFTPGTLTVTQREVELRWDPLDSSTPIAIYDGVSHAPTATVTNLVNGDEIGVTVTGGAINAGDHTAVASVLTGEKASNYSLPVANTYAFTIGMRPITISGITANDKTYDGNADAELDYAGVTFGNIVTGETLTVSAIGVFAESSEGAGDGKNVGTNKTVTITSLILGGTNADNYVLAESGQQTTTTADITAKVITASGDITASNKPYDGNTTATLVYSGVTLTDKIENDNVLLTAVGTFDTKDVGTSKTVSISNITLAGDDAGNYTLTSSIPTSTTAAITAKEITASGNITANDKPYDGNRTATLDCTVTLTGKVENDDISFTATGIFDSKDVGTDKTVTITPDLAGADASNYSLVSSSLSTSTTANITPASLTITANDHNITYGSAPENNGVIYSGFVVGENENTEGMFTGALTYVYKSKDGSTVYTTTIPHGEFDIIPGGLTAGNYDIAYVAGTLTVGSKSLESTGITIDTSEGIVKDGETVLTLNVDYTVTGPTTSGRYTSTVYEGIGNYTGTVSIRFANVTFMSDGSEGATDWSATFVADGNHALPIAEDISVYIIESIDVTNNTVNLTELNYIPDGVPVLLISNANHSGFLVKNPTSYTAITDAQESANMLKKSTGQSFALRQIYLLYNNEFVLNIPGTLEAGKIYLENPNYPYSSSARLRISRAASTGISGMKDDNNTDNLDDRWFTIDGRRLNGKPTKKGLYILNGEKVVIK